MEFLNLSNNFLKEIHTLFYKLNTSMLTLYFVFLIFKKFKTFSKRA